MEGSSFDIIQMMYLCRKIIFATNSNAWECLGIHGHFLVKNVIILIFWHKSFSKGSFTQITAPVRVHCFSITFMMLQINKTKHFLNRAETVLFMQFLSE